ncbi:MAG: hypothetical protein R3Y12_09135 [Clostridia bacterium]
MDDNPIINAILFCAFFRIASRTKLGPIKSTIVMFIIFVIIPACVASAQKYGFWSEYNLALYIVTFVFAMFFWGVKIAIRKFNRMVGYVNSDKKTFVSIDGRNVVVVQRNMWGTPFIYLNEKLVFEGDKKLDGGIIISDVNANWTDNNCKVTLSTLEQPCYMELDYIVEI